MRSERAGKKEREKSRDEHERRRVREEEEQTRGRVRLHRDGAQPGTGERKSRVGPTYLLEVARAEELLH